MYGMYSGTSLINSMLTSGVTEKCSPYSMSFNSQSPDTLLAVATGETVGITATVQHWPIISVVLPHPEKKKM